MTVQGANQGGGRHASSGNTRFQEHFPGAHRVFLPVVHPIGPDEAMRAIRIAVEAEADGVFLINQGMDSTELLEFIPEVSWEFPQLWLGVNLLGQEPAEALELVKDLPVGGIWTDDAGIDVYDDEQPRAAAFVERRKELKWDGLLFGGVAFKYVHHVEDDDLSENARIAAPFMDVVTTSGPGTGMAAKPTKVQLLRQGLGAHPLGLASGVTPENVDAYLPFVDAYLVASGIEEEFGVLDPELTRQLARKIRNYVP